MIHYDYQNGFENAIKHTKLFDYLMALNYFYPIIKAVPSDNRELIEELKKHNLTRKRFLQVARITIKRLEEIIARIINKAKKDYKKQHNIVEYAPSAFEFPITEETSRNRREKRLAIIEKRLKLVRFLCLTKVMTEQP